MFFCLWTSHACFEARVAKRGFRLEVWSLLKGWRCGQSCVGRLVGFPRVSEASLPVLVLDCGTAALPRARWHDLLARRIASP